MNSGFQETPPTRHHQVVQSCVLSTLHLEILSTTQLTQMQQEPMSILRGLQNNSSKGKITLGQIFLAISRFSAFSLS